MEPLLRLRKIHCIFGCQNFIFAKFERKNLLNETCGFLMGNRSLDLRDAGSSTLPPDNRNTVSVFNESEIWVTYINNVLSNKTILFDILDFWCQLVVIRFVKTLSKRRMFVSSMKISACWLLHRLIKFNKICWEKRPAKTRPNLRTSFCRRDLKNTQPHLKFDSLQTRSKVRFVFCSIPRLFVCLRMQMSSSQQ